MSKTAETTVRAAIYARISNDSARDGHGVANQEDGAERLVTDRGWQMAGRYCDNDLSAYSGVRRPDYQRLMADARARKFDAIVVFHTSRLWRTRRERADGIEVLRHAAVSVVAVKGPSLDMSTAYGRGMAGLVGEFDTMESEVKSERQKHAAEQAAKAGKRWTGCPRPFGYQADHVTPDPVEAEAITAGARALLGGSTVSAVCRDWAARGLRSVQTGRPFTRQSVATILRNPAIAGLSTLPRRPGERYGEIAGPGNWTPVLTESTWRAVVALLGDPSRVPARGVRTLLGGLARCSCGNAVIGTQNATGKAVYRCNPVTRGDRPGPHCQQMIGPVDEHVARRIVARLARSDLADLITPKRPDLTPLRTEAAAVRRNLDQDAVDELRGGLTRSQLIARTEWGTRRLAEIDAMLADAASESVLAPFMSPKVSARKVWDGLDGARQRAVIAALCAVTIGPAGRGARVFDSDTVTFDPVGTI